MIPLSDSLPSTYNNIVTKQSVVWKKILHDSSLLPCGFHRCSAIHLSLWYSLHKASKPMLVKRYLLYYESFARNKDNGRKILTNVIEIVYVISMQMKWNYQEKKIESPIWKPNNLSTSRYVRKIKRKRNSNPRADDKNQFLLLNS